VKSPVSPGGTGQVTVATAPNATCTIVVTYMSGASRAQGLIPQVASASGTARWTWIIGTNTTAGTWPIVVTCGNATARTTFVVQ
jgi:micrococcal nuclease